VISKESFSKEWIQNKRKLYPKTDPQLIERQIYAFELVGLLAKSEQEFIFKGGTSLLLLLPSAHRLSIDVDIVGYFELKDLRELISGSVFIRVEEDERKKKEIPKKHFKFFYISALDRRETYVLLDVLYTNHGFPKILSVPINNAIFKVEEEVNVNIPTIDGILGDKLTAFAPNTTGVPFGRRKSMEIIKQIFDIGKLFNESKDIDQVRTAYQSIQKEESKYRKGNPTLNETLEDTIETSFLFCQSRLKGSKENENIAEMHQGIKQIQSYLLGEAYRIEDARISVSRAVFLATVLKKNKKNLKLSEVRFSDSRIEQVKDVILKGDLEILNRLKATQTETFYYWWLISQL